MAGVTGAWGQTDYSGIYYIASDGNAADIDGNAESYTYSPSATNTNYYIVPTEYPQQSDEKDAYFDGTVRTKPFLTTDKTNQVAEAIWVVTKVTDDDGTFYYIQHAQTEKYVIYEPLFTGGDSRRKCMHLVGAAPSSDAYKFIIDERDGACYMVPKSQQTATHKYWNIADKNRPCRYGLGSSKYYGGLIGLFQLSNNKLDVNSRFKFEDAKCVTPVILFDNTTGQVTIETTTTGATIYYTMDGTNPDPTHVGGEYATRLYDPDNKPIVSSPTTIKGIAVKNLTITVSEVATKTIAVNPTINVAIPTDGYTYDGTAKEPKVSVLVNGTTLDADEYEVDYSGNTNAGTATVSITDGEGGDYIVYGTTTFTIAKAPLTITANNHTITYGETPTGNGVTYTGLVNGETESVLGGTLGYAYSYAKYNDVGEYIITPDGLESNNYAIIFVPGTLTVNQKTLTIIADAKEKTYGDADPESGLTYTSDGLVGTDVITGELAREAGEDAGTYAINQNTLTVSNSNNYSITYTGANFTINPKELTVTANNHTITYGDAPAGNGVAYSGFVNGETESVLGGTLDYDYSYTQYGDVGNTYTITPKGLSATNYSFNYVAGTLTVTQKEVGIVWGETTLTYTGTEQVPTVTATGTVNNDEISVTLTGGQTNAGAGYTATTSGLSGTKASNYILPENRTTEFSIAKAPLIVTAKNHTLTYGDAPTNNGVTFTGFVNGETESVIEGTVDYDYSYTQFGNVGNYTITPKGLSATNYSFNYESGSLTVNPKKLALTWGESSYTYDGTAHAPSATLTTSGDIVNGDVIGIAVTLSAQQGSSLTNAKAINAGRYKATASLTGDKSGNYSPLPASLSFTITSKNIGEGNETATGFEVNMSTEEDNGDVNAIVTSVKDGAKTLVLNTDYTVETITQGFDNYIIVTGIGNYGGSYQRLFVKPVFFKPTGATDYAAVYRAPLDISAPEGITPYIVRKVNPSIGTINITPVDYLPENVPVLMLADADVKGFFATSKEEDDSAITAQTENSNQLKVASDDGMAVEAAQVYMFYQGEFVLTKAGTLTEGKFYLYNPNYSATQNPAAARSVLHFVEEEPTDIIEMRSEKDESVKDSTWYSLDGRRLSGKPAKQGLYIRNGCKTVIKSK